MIAKIVDKDKREYYSVVFAICENGWNTAVIVYDDEKHQFSFIRMYRHTKNLVRSVFLIDCDKNDFIENKSVKMSFCKTIKHISGYEWLVGNNELFIDILKNKQVDDCYKEKAEEMNRQLSVSEWTLVKDKQDVKNLMATAWDFHDGIIEQISFNQGYDTVEIIFSGCWGCKMTLRFKEEVAIHFCSGDPFFARFVMDSNVFFENGFVYWVDDCGICCEAELAEAKDRNYFKARSLFWKQETEYDTTD